MARNQGQKDKGFEEEIKGKKRNSSHTQDVLALLNVLPAGPTNWAPPKARELLGQERATVHGGAREASGKKSEGSHRRCFRRTKHALLRGPERPAQGGAAQLALSC